MFALPFYYPIRNCDKPGWTRLPCWFAFWRGHPAHIGDWMRMFHHLPARMYVSLYYELDFVFIVVPFLSKYFFSASVWLFICFVAFLHLQNPSVLAPAVPPVPSYGRPRRLLHPRYTRDLCACVRWCLYPHTHSDPTQRLTTLTCPAPTQHIPVVAIFFCGQRGNGSFTQD